MAVVEPFAKSAETKGMAQSLTSGELRETRYVLITPVRDEEIYIAAMIDSIISQEIAPTKWVIVDDGSSDQTPTIVDSYARKFTFIELVRLPARGLRRAGGEGAIPTALQRINGSDFDFLARFDADLMFTPDYITSILGEFHRDPTLGIAGGGLYTETKSGLDLEMDPDFHVRGALKMYRRQCFEDIGGLTAEIGWDTIDEVRAWTKGWRTRSFYDYKVIHRRSTGEALHPARIYWERGRGEYLTWSIPMFVLAKAIKIAITHLSVVMPACLWAGFLYCYMTGEQRIQDPAFAKARREQQRRRMATLLTSRNYLINSTAFHDDVAK